MFSGRKLKNKEHIRVSKRHRKDRLTEGRKKKCHGVTSSFTNDIQGPTVHLPVLPHLD